MTALYHKVTVYVMVKGPYQFHQFAGIIAVMKLSSITAAATWVYYIEQYNNFFCNPFVFPQTWSYFPSFKSISSTLFVTNKRHIASCYNYYIYHHFDICS